MWAICDTDLKNLWKGSDTDGNDRDYNSGRKWTEERILEILPAGNKERTGHPGWDTEVEIGQNVSIGGQWWNATWQQSFRSVRLCSYFGWTDRISERGTPGESQMLSEDWETDPADGERRWAGSAEIEIHKRTEMGRSSFENELQLETGT